MEEQGDCPNSSEISYFQRMVSAHDKVQLIEQRGSQKFIIHRVGEMTAVIVYLTDLYTVGGADVYRIAADCRGVNCIVTTSMWNRYTKDAKRDAAEMKIGLFTPRELMGALHLRYVWSYQKQSSER